MANLSSFEVEDAMTNNSLTAPNSIFDSGVFTVGDTGNVGIDFLFDGGWYQGELAIFSLDGMEQFEPGAEGFIKEAARRALSNSELGHVAISDPTEGARFSGLVPGDPTNYNAGEFQGIKTFEMRPGDKFGVMLIPNGTLQQVFDNPAASGELRPLFSMGTANPDDAFDGRQIADVTGAGHTFAMEDFWSKGWTDKDYNDLIFRVWGATGQAVHLDQVIDPAKDWRSTEVGQQLLNYVRSTNPLDTLPIDPETGAKYKPGEILVEFKPDVTDTQIQSLAQAYGAIAVESLVPLQQPSPLSQWRVLKFNPQTDLLQTRTSLAQDIRVEALEFNYVLSINGVPNDTGFNQLWGLNNTGQVVAMTPGTPDADIDAPEAWEIQKGSKNAIVAVIDTGVDYTHQDLATNIWKNLGEIANDGIDNDGNDYVDDVFGYDFTSKDNNPRDDYGHGTHVAGTIGAVGNNNLGVVGVSQNVSIMPLKVNQPFTLGISVDAVVEAIMYATKMGAKVINASFGGSFNSNDPKSIERSNALFQAISHANNAGVLFIASAGNNGGNNDITQVYPANYDLPNVISVAATDNNDLRSGFSNYGAKTVDLAAPGDKIYSTLPNNQYDYYSGTSMAAPHVAGTAALLLAQNPSLTAVQLKNILLSTTDPVSSMQGISVTGGRLNAHKALLSLMEPNQPDIPDQPDMPDQPSIGQLIEGTDDNDTLYGTAGNDTIYGKGGDDELYGNQGDDEIYGNQGNDSLWGGKDNDSLFGDLGNDTLYGDLGDDTLRGGKDNDTLRGGKDNDSLFGDLGDDILYGDLGDEILNGGEGNDVFVFAQDSGNDTIEDFTVGPDRIDLTDYDFMFGSTSPNITDDGSKTLIDLDGTNQITLTGVVGITFDPSVFIV